MTPCTGILGRLFGHKYEARYSKSDSRPFTLQGVPAPFIAEIMEASKSSTYHHDICCRCGHVVSKEHK